MLTETPQRPADARPSLAGPPLNAPPQVNECVRRFIQEAIDLCQPDAVVWCDGSRAERDRLLEQGVKEGVFVKLNEQKLPGCYYHRSNPNDVARSEHLTFICAPSQDTAG